MLIINNNKQRIVINSIPYTFQLQPNSAAGAGALEHDLCCLYRPLSRLEMCPGPLPLGVAVIDQSVTLFGTIFPRMANKHRLEVLEIFGKLIKHEKGIRQEAVQMNIFTALLSGLKGLTETKSSIGQENVRKSATSLIINALISANPILRCAAGEALGRIAQVVGDSRFTAELAQHSFDKLKSARDVVSRTGHSLALGCLHRYVGGMGSSQHLSTSVSILLALAQDGSSPVVQVWSLYALALIADSGGPMFRGYVEPTLSMSLKLFLSVPQSLVDVHQCIGRVLSALIITVGPELQGNTTSIATARSSLLCACAIMEAHSDPLVQAEATSCLQQLHMFAPKHVNLSTLVPTLCTTLSSNYLMLRKAAVSCLRQLTQREAKEVCEHAMTLMTGDIVDPSASSGIVITETGLPGVLFGMLDTETDPEMIKNIHDTISSMLQMLAADNLSQWLSMCKNVLTVATDSATGEDASGKDNKRGGKSNQAGKDRGASTKVGLGDADDDDDDDEDDDDDMDMEYHAEENTSSHPAVQPRWPTRVYTATCVRKIISTCEQANAAHFDLLLAKELQMTKSTGDYLVLHLSDLIRMAFMAATSDSDQLRLEGLSTLQEIIIKFARVPEPEFPGHLLLEQFQAQVGAALRPAFSADTPSHVTAAACDVCSAWIGSGVARDLNDLRRVHQLLVSSLNKLHTKSTSSQLYNESLATLEKLSILKAWADVYIVAMVGNGSAPASLITKKLSFTNAAQIAITTNDDDGSGFGDFESRGESLLSLVQPELKNLSQHWLAALKDYALLLLPAEYSSQLPRDGGAFYTTETMHSSKPHYMSTWPSILYASSLWLNAGGFQDLDRTEEDGEQQKQLDNEKKRPTAAGHTNAITHGSVGEDRFHLIFGICMEALCSTRSNERVEIVKSCLQALFTTFDSEWARSVLMKSIELNVELCHVLHRLILTRDNLEIQLMCMEVLRLTLAAHQEYVAEERLKLTVEEASEEGDESKRVLLRAIGDGGESGDIVHGKSHAYSVLEVCLCLLVRQIPSLNPSENARVTAEQLQRQWASSSSSNAVYKIGEDNGVLVAAALKCLIDLPKMCSQRGAIAVLPTILYLATNVIKEIATKSSTDETIIANCGTIQVTIQCIKAMVTHPHGTDKETAAEWNGLLQSALGKIIDLTKTGCDETKMDEVTMMLTIGIFVLHVPVPFISNPEIQYPCINHFRQCLLSPLNPVKIKAIQTARSFFLKADVAVATPYIHALAPRIVEILYTSNFKKDSENSDDLDLVVILECISTVEALVARADPSKRKFEL